MNAVTTPTEATFRLGPGPYSFSGVPPLIAGEIELINDTDEKLKLKAIRIAGSPDVANRFGFGEVVVGTKVRPRARVQAPARLSLDSGTPPGTYPLELELDGQYESLTLRVLENLVIRLEPDEIRLEGVAGDVLTKPVVARNEGNMGRAVPDAALLFLEERDWVGRSMVQALRDTQEEEGHQQYLDRLVQELRSTLVRPARVTFSTDAGVVRPGETLEIQVEVTLPEGLIKGRTYVGSIPFMGDRLFFEVECSGSMNSTKRRTR